MLEKTIVVVGVGNSDHASDEEIVRIMVARRFGDRNGTDRNGKERNG